MSDPLAELADAHRREWAFVLAATVRVTGSIDLAEECTQDAFVAALGAWPERGVPSNPGGWLAVTARRRAIDVLRRERSFRDRLPLLLIPDAQDDPVDAGPIPDDRLRLIFTCCHPALARESQVALTLRLVCGLSTVDIARQHLVSESTMAARITRAKKKIEAAGIPYRVPTAADLPERLDAVLTVVHVLFTAGHTASEGDDLVREDLVAPAIDLARMLLALMPSEPEVQGLLALLLLADSRRSTRTTDDGRLVLLAHQDRSQWDRALIAEGAALVESALRAGSPGRYAIQAAIAALHAEAPTYAETDWTQIFGLYMALMAVWPSPVVALNRAVALAAVSGPASGLSIVDGLSSDPRLRAYPYLHAARADLLRQLGRKDEAASAYKRALDLTTNAAERRFLAERHAEVSSG